MHCVRAPAQPYRSPGAPGERGATSLTPGPGSQPDARACRLMAQPVEVAPSVAKGGAAGSSSAARSCASRALPLGPSTLEAEPSRAAGGSAEHADEQRGGEARAIRTPLAPAQLQAEPRYQNVPWHVVTTPGFAVPCVSWPGS